MSELVALITGHVNVLCRDAIGPLNYVSESQVRIFPAPFLYMKIPGVKVIGFLVLSSKEADRTLLYSPLCFHNFKEVNAKGFY